MLTRLAQRLQEINGSIRGASRRSMNVDALIIYGLKPTFIKDAHAILDWVNAQGISLVILGRAGRYFDIEQQYRSEKITWKSQDRLVSLLLLAFAVMSSLSLLLDRPILRF